jgi:hypothetical protein
MAEREIPGWYREAAREMIRLGCGLKQASHEVGRELTGTEAMQVERREEFQKILKEEKDRYYAAIATRPTRSKEVAIGILVDSIEKLHQQGDYDKAAAAIEKLGKLLGWFTDSASVSVFAGLTAKEIEDQKKKILEKLADPRSSAPEPIAN